MVKHIDVVPDTARRLQHRDCCVVYCMDNDRGDEQMNDKEIIEKIQANQWWPFDRVDPKILQELVRRDKQDQLDAVGEALL